MKAPECRIKSLQVTTIGDTDSDTAYIGNNPLILEKVKKAQKYLIPINEVPQKAKKYKFTDEDMGTVDGQLCNDFIGKICNLARDLQSLYWHLFNTGTEENQKEYLDMIYDDICLLEVLSNIAIDSAKRQYECNVANEMKKIKTRPYMTATGAIIKDDTVVFDDIRYKKLLSEDNIRDYEEYVSRRDKAVKNGDTEELEKVNEEIDKLLLTKKIYMVRPDFAKDLKSAPRKKHKKSPEDKNITDEQKELNRQKQIAYAAEQKALKEKIYRTLESPMDILKSVIKENKGRCDRTNLLPSFTEVLKPIPKGVKADYNRIKAIKDDCREAKRCRDLVQVEYNLNRKSFDEMYEEKKNIEKDIINKIKNREVTMWDIHKLIRDVYDIHPKKDKHGKVIRDSNNKIVLSDKRDKTMIDNEMGGLLLQWVYAAHPDKFLSVIKSCGQGTVSYVKRYEESKKDTIKVNSLKDIKDIFPEDKEPEIFILDGERYIIEKRDPIKVNK